MIINPYILGESGGPPPPPNPLNDAIAAWHLDEASGTRYDSGPNGYHLTENNGVGTATAKLGTNAAKFLHVDNEWLSHADNANLRIGSDRSFTVAAWCYLDNQAHSQHFVSKASWAIANRAEFTIMYHSAANGILFYVWNEGNTVTISCEHPFNTTGVWFFVVASYDHTTRTSYLSVNNSDRVIATGAGDFVAAGTVTDFTIGRMADWANLNGRVDEVVRWNRVLNVDEITYLWNAGNGRVYEYPSPFRISSSPSTYWISNPWNGKAGWYAGYFTTKGDPSTFSTSGFNWTTDGYARFVSSYRGFSTPYVADTFMAPGYGDTVYNTVRRFVSSNNATVQIDGQIIAGALAGRTVICRVFHNNTQIYTFTIAANTAYDFAYHIDDFEILAGDTISWEMDKTLGDYVAADITFSGVLS